jgi:hypothetical protein
VSARRIELAVERQRLLVRSAVMREQVAAQSAALAPVLHWGDRVLYATWWARAHPALIASAVVVIAVVRPRFAWRWTFRAFGAWKFWRSWRTRLAPLTADLSSTSPHRSADRTFRS